MQTIPETFKNCKTIEIKEICPICGGKLHHKRVEIDDSKFGGAKRIGISHKAINFCSNLACPYIEQGVIYRKGTKEKFLSLEEVDQLIENFLNEKKPISY